MVLFLYNCMKRFKLTFLRQNILKNILNQIKLFLNRMGQTFSEPVTEKESTTEKNDVFLVSSSSIQGWRISKCFAKYVFTTFHIVF